jgi:hypothetical protein
MYRIDAATISEAYYYPTDKFGPGVRVKFAVPDRTVQDTMGLVGPAKSRLTKLAEALNMSVPKPDASVAQISDFCDALIGRAVGANYYPSGEGRYFVKTYFKAKQEMTEPQTKPKTASQSAPAKPQVEVTVKLLPRAKQVTAEAIMTRARVAAKEAGGKVVSRNKRSEIAYFGPNEAPILFTGVAELAKGLKLLKPNEVLAE